MGKFYILKIAPRLRHVFVSDKLRLSERRRHARRTHSKFLSNEDALSHQRASVPRRAVMFSSAFIFLEFDVLFVGFLFKGSNLLQQLLTVFQGLRNARL